MTALPLLAGRWLIRAAGCLVPRAERAAWRARWSSDLFNLVLLVERGDLAGAALPQVAWLSRRAAASALRAAVREHDPRRLLPGPGFVLGSILAVLAVEAAASRGLAKTRYLAAALRDVLSASPADLNHHMNALVAYSFPMAIALGSAAVLVVLAQPSLRRYGWRYWAFLALKTLGAMLAVCLVWIEGGAALRSVMPTEGLRVVVGAIGFCLFFVALFCRAVRWSFTDQRNRCPVCLRRLAMPVAVGSWASVLDPPATELLCSEGHGALCRAETGISEPDRWVELDSSWRAMFL